MAGTVEYRVNRRIFCKKLWGAHEVEPDFEQQLDRVNSTAGIPGAKGHVGFPDRGNWFLRDRIEQSTWPSGTHRSVWDMNNENTK